MIAMCRITIFGQPDDMVTIRLAIQWRTRHIECFLVHDVPVWTSAEDVTVAAGLGSLVYPGHID